MQQQESNYIPDNAEEVLNIAQENFGFLLFIKKFQIVDVQREDYQIFSILFKGEFLVLVNSDRDGIVDVTLAPLDTPLNEWWKWSRLQVLIYYLSNKQRYIGYPKKKEKLAQEFSWFSGFIAEYFEPILELYTGKQVEQYQMQIDALNKEIDQIVYLSTKKSGK